MPLNLSDIQIATINLRRFSRGEIRGGPAKQMAAAIAGIHNVLTQLEERSSLSCCTIARARKVPRKIVDYAKYQAVIEMRGDKRKGIGDYVERWPHRHRDQMRSHDPGDFDAGPSDPPELSGSPERDTPLCNKTRTWPMALLKAPDAFFFFGRRRTGKKSRASLDEHLMNNSATSYGNEVEIMLIRRKNERLIRFIIPVRQPEETEKFRRCGRELFSQKPYTSELIDY
ncbi:hypothetical protein GEV33_012419 [Tenebrio molitor]|uniref:Uncharacterized protein n=1 Tax=Tenebrio molitor TaxID=7067 RepID=A0A8J6L932_TENMO|nr:hypothetical protein GEV33_012419 [Tenebrio molitor]